MFLFKGKMGTVMHTGDFRFSEQMLQHPALFPEFKKNQDMKSISIDVDYLFLDNTFADPVFDTPLREVAYNGLVDIIKAHKNHRVYAFTYNLGKEEVFINLAQDFETLVMFNN